MSGAGRSTALHVLEDLGFYCIDNLPARLVPMLLELMSQRAPAGDPKVRRIGLGIDVRTGAFLEGTDQVFDQLASEGYAVEVLFLECADDVLLRRFSESRRPHPLAPGGDVLDAVQRERERLALLRARSRFVIDTSRLSVHQLRKQLVDQIAQGSAASQMVTRLVSFGFKYGLPIDADLVFDVRYLPNPHFVPELRPLPGTEAAVAAYVLNASETREFMEDLLRMLEHVLPRYASEGKAYLTIAVGCTGGKHRSVALSEALAERLRPLHSVLVVHRDVARG